MKIKNILYSLGLTAVLGLNTSCEDYLDKSPESEISEETAFQSFRNFQGFLEENYKLIPVFDTDYWNNAWNYGEDEILNAGNDYMLTSKIDKGDFWGWQTEFDGWRCNWTDKRAGDGTAWKPTDSFNGNNEDNRFNSGMWPAAWYCIRKCNIGLANLNLLKDATSQQRDFIKGQLYFFRAWWHFQLMKYFGGMPYIDEVLAGGDLQRPRLSYFECAEKVAADLEEAYKLLPIDWDKEPTGADTKGKNQFRINKCMVLGYMGKNYLYAASPLMNKTMGNGESYNQEYAQKAADKFAELIKLIESGSTQYKMLDFDKYWNICYTRDWVQAGGTESIFRGNGREAWNGTGYGTGTQYFPGQIGKSGNGELAGIHTWPTANYVNYFGMENGLPLDDPDSGFDPTHPFKGRDPRFYADFVYDGCDMLITASGLDQYEYAELYTDGFMRNASAMETPDKENRTGYINIKVVPLDQNGGAGIMSYGKVGIHISWMRIPDIYLMYAEAQAQATSSATTPNSICGLSPVDAINVVRDRAGVGHVAAKFTSSVDAFMKELIRERAVELAFEGHRFNDLRRWLLLDKYPYTIKTSQEFTRAKEFDPKADPKDLEVKGWSEKVLLTRDFKEKHYWWPLKRKDCNVYPEFYQNPGW